MSFYEAQKRMGLGLFQPTAKRKRVNRRRLAVLIVVAAGALVSAGLAGHWVWQQHRAARGGAAANWPEGVTFTAFDTETTGFGSAQHRLVEIGAVKFREGKLLDQATWRIHPGMPIPPDATDVHGITDAMVAQAPAFPAVYIQFKAFIGDDVLLAHNAPFDISFLRAEAARAGLEPLNNPVIDTLPLFRRWYPEAPSHSLSNLVERLGLANGTSFHRADADAMHLFRVLGHALETRSTPLTMPDLYFEAGGAKNFRE